MRFLDASNPEFDQKLTEALESLPSATPFYTAAMRAYQRHYLGESLKQDLSFLMFQDTGDLAAYAPLYFCQANGRYEFSYAGSHLRAPLIAAPETAPVHGRIERSLMERIDELANTHNVECYRAAIEPLSVVQGSAMSNYLRQYGFRDESTATQVIDLSATEDDLWGSVRKSYRPLINKTGKSYSVRVVDRAGFDRVLCEEYGRLHRLAAGRETRSKESFEKMYDMVAAGDAFLVLARNAQDQWGGAWLFFQKFGYVHYSSSGIDPEIDVREGVGHLGIWSAIQYARAQGQHSFHLGWQPYEDEAGFNEKVANIAKFKRGFGGKRVAWFRGSKQYG